MSHRFLAKISHSRFIETCVANRLFSVCDNEFRQPNNKIGNYFQSTDRLTSELDQRYGKSFNISENGEKYSNSENLQFRVRSELFIYQFLTDFGVQPVTYLDIMQNSSGCEHPACQIKSKLVKTGYRACEKEENISEIGTCGLYQGNEQLSYCEEEQIVDFDFSGILKFSIWPKTEFGEVAVLQREINCHVFSFIGF